MVSLYTSDDPDLLTSVLAGENVHLDPAAILDGLTDAQAHTKPHGLPYSIARSCRAHVLLAGMVQ